MCARGGRPGPTRRAARARPAVHAGTRSARKAGRLGLGPPPRPRPPRPRGSAARPAPRRPSGGSGGGARADPCVRGYKHTQAGRRVRAGRGGTGRDGAGRGLEDLVLLRSYGDRAEEREIMIMAMPKSIQTSRVRLQYLEDLVLLGLAVLLAVEEVPDVLLVDLQEGGLELVPPPALRLRGLY